MRNIYTTIWAVHSCLCKTKVVLLCQGVLLQRSFLCNSCGQSHPTQFLELHNYITLGHFLWGFFPCRGLLVSHMAQNLPATSLPHPQILPFSVTLSLQLMQFRRLLPNISSLIIQHGKIKVWSYRTKIVPAFSKIVTYIAKIKIWLVSQLDWTKFDTEQLQVTGESDDNASLLLLKSKMVLILFLQKIGYGASVAVLTLIMLSLSLLFSGPAQNSDTV